MWGGGGWRGGGGLYRVKEAASPDQCGIEEGSHDSDFALGIDLLGAKFASGDSSPVGDDRPLLAEEWVVLEGDQVGWVDGKGGGGWGAGFGHQLSGVRVRGVGLAELDRSSKARDGDVQGEDFSLGGRVLRGFRESGLGQEEVGINGTLLGGGRERGVGVGAGGRAGGESGERWSGQTRVLAADGAGDAGVDVADEVGGAGGLDAALLWDSADEQRLSVRAEASESWAGVFAGGLGEEVVLVPSPPGVGEAVAGVVLLAVVPALQCGGAGADESWLPTGIAPSWAADGGVFILADVAVVTALRASVEIGSAEDIASSELVGLSANEAGVDVGNAKGFAVAAGDEVVLVALDAAVCEGLAGAGGGVEEPSSQ